MFTLTSVSAGIVAVLGVYIIRANKKMPKKIPVPKCYHCEEDDKIQYVNQNFFCECCGKVIDAQYMLHYYEDDVHQAMKGKNDYDKYKQLRKIHNEKLGGKKSA